MTTDSFDATDAVDRRTVKSVTKLLLAAASLVFVLYLLMLLPRIDMLDPGASVTVAAVVGAIGTLVLVVLFLSAAPEFASLTRTLFDGPREVVEHLASIVYWLVVLAAVLVAHRGFTGLLVPAFGDWLYDVVFLLAALPAVAVIAARLYLALEPGAGLLAEGVPGGDEENTAR